MEQFSQMIATALKLPVHRVENTLKLLQGGATIPFISRYRKEAIENHEDNVVVNAPHTALEVAGEWNHPYTRMQAAYPLEWISRAKFFPYVSKIDNGYGDRNLCCRNCE